ncbi:hypothetical protein ASG35_03015 [Burkholderia sp. Leaf177]|uniref:primase-helicase family protein n=1 Tax=Burkholderia sp. Leaf177 TaxID=1736287 RepID=UPI000714D933|nr:primase-helicase family protein [Burkholderia sp. Leaf177]KQR90196.1 hypothetical protein ASG35_03015 [Burkholderia sp. Leaf177]
MTSLAQPDKKYFSSAINNIAFDIEEFERFVKLARPNDGSIQILAIPKNGGSIQIPAMSFALPGGFDAAAEWAAEYNMSQFNMYWTVNELKPSSNPTKKAKKVDIARGLFVQQDFDPRAGAAYDDERARLLAHATTLAAVASFVVDSGNGVQAFYRLAVPTEFSEQDWKKDANGPHEAINKRLCAGSDSVFNIDRIMKLPGSVMWQPASKIAEKGYPDVARVVRVLSQSEKSYTLAEIEALAPKVEAVTAKAAATTTIPKKQRVSRSADAVLEAFEKLKTSHAKLSARLAGDGTGLNDPSGSGRLQSIVGILKAARFTDSEILTLPIAWPGGDAAKDLDRAVRKSFEGSIAEPMPEVGSYEDVMSAINERHAVTLVGGTCVVIRENDNDLPDFLNKTSFETFHAALKYEYEATDGQTGEIVTKTAAAAPAWVKSPLRRTFDGVEFAPGGGRAGYYNLFRGFAVEPAAGDCSLFFAHLLENICQGDAAQFAYLTCWLADLVQNPGAKPGVAISISGKKGTGKSKLADTIAALLGTHAVTVSNADQLTGRFNAHHSTALLITGEESFWAGDKKAEGALKHMITSEKIALERKGVDIAMIDNYSRFIFVGNAEWLFPATQDERRLFALECGEAHRLDYAYFAAIDAQMYGRAGLKRITAGVEPTGLKALLAHLLAIDLRGWQIRAVPETKGLRAQRSATLEPHFQFMYDAIEAHELVGEAWTGEMRIQKGKLYEQFVESARRRGVTHPCDNRVFGLRVKETFGWGTVQSSDDLRYWKVTPWAESKSAFERSRKVTFLDDDAEHDDTLFEGDFTAETYLQKFTKRDIEQGLDLL